jgi:hypothetical protein
MTELISSPVLCLNHSKLSHISVKANNFYFPNYAIFLQCLRKSKFGGPCLKSLLLTSLSSLQLSY